MEIHANTKLYEETERDPRRPTGLWRPMVIHAITKLYGEIEINRD